MPKIAIRLVRLPEHDTRFVDVTSAGLRVERDGDRYQYFALMASGQQVKLDHPDVGSNPDFWRAAVAAAVESLRAGYANIEPLPDPSQPIDISVDFSAVGQMLASGRELPTLADGVVLDEWVE